jgi:hypothetical protein
MLSTHLLEVMCKVEGTYKLSKSYYKLVVVGQRGLLRGHRPCHMYGWGTFRERVIQASAKWLGVSRVGVPSPPQKKTLVCCQHVNVTSLNRVCHCFVHVQGYQWGCLFFKSIFIVEFSTCQLNHTQVRCLWLSHMYFCCWVQFGFCSSSEQLHITLIVISSSWMGVAMQTL